jgi:hypothetical protein
MKRPVILIVLAVLAYAYLQERTPSLPGPSTPPGDEAVLLEAYEKKQSNIQVQGEGVVVRLLRDDLDGSRHQRFIVELRSGQTLLITHNIDLAPRIDDLRIGSAVEFFGEYEWNSNGGVVHWTHHDPQGRHVAGWIKHRSRTYQ